MKLYLAGPMRGYPDFNFPAFHAGAARLRAAGYEVISPAEKDLAKAGDIFTGTNGTDAELEAVGFNLADALIWDMKVIAYVVDGIAMLDGWEKSKGVAAEKALAEALNKPAQPISHYLGE